MTRGLLATWVLSLVLAAVGSAQGAASSGTKADHFTHGQLKQLAREAHTRDQYQFLADYYGQQQHDYSQRTEVARQKWDSLSLHTITLAAKYPSPVDSARYRYQDLAYKASEMAALNAKYSQLAEQ